MSLRMPRRLGGGDQGMGSLDALNYEIAQEQAATLARLARLGRRLQEALDALAAFDAGADAGDAEARDARVGAAGEALWYYVVQREVLGLGASEAVLRELAVPREVRLRMGLNRRRG